MPMMPRPNPLKAALAAIISCAFAVSPSVAEDIRLTGSSTVAPVMVEIGKLFEENETAHRTFVETGGSSKGIADLRKGLSDIAMISRPLKDNEQDLVGHVIARDGIAALVHADNPITEISVDDLRSVFTGQISNWSELGGADSEIFVVSKGEGSATSVVLNDFLGVTADQIDGDIVAAANAQMIKTLSLTPGGIGYVSIGAAMVNIELGVPIKLIGLGSVPPTPENVANGTYQATRPLNLVTFPDTDDSVDSLIEFSKSEMAAEIIRDLAYTPVTR